MRSLFLIFTLLLLTSCSQNSEQKVAGAIDMALSYLSHEDCDEAIKVLSEAGYQDSNAVYLQVLASAHACKAGFDEIAFIANDLASIDAATPATIFQSLSIMSLSTETSADSEDYKSILTGINLSLNNRTQVERNQKFGSRKAGDLGFQALILDIVNLGKFFHYYGNVDSSGEKGEGSGTSTCFLNYNDPRAQIIVGSGVTGSCVTNNGGHPDLDQTTANGKRRICEGLMTLTNTIEILENLDFSGSSELSKLDDISDQINTFKTAAVAAGLGDLINMTSQSSCETYLGTPAQLLNMEYLYAIIFETGLQ